MQKHDINIGERVEFGTSVSPDSAEGEAKFFSNDGDTDFGRGAEQVLEDDVEDGGALVADVYSGATLFVEGEESLVLSDEEGLVNGEEAILVEFVVLEEFSFGFSEDGVSETWHGEMCALVVGEGKSGVNRLRTGGIDVVMRQNDPSCSPARRVIQNDMELTRTAYGTWNGGRFMHFGEPIDDARFCATIQQAYQKGVRTFITSDVYGNGAADSMLGEALAGIPRDTYCLVGLVGHDFYKGERNGSKGFPRFTDPVLRKASDYADYLEMAVARSLERCRTDRFDCVMLHNPDSIGYSQDSVWKGMQSLQERKLTELLGVAPGPANGFTLDLILCFERFGALVDWGMVILNPLEPWPGRLCLEAATKYGVKLTTRVVDHGGLFHGDVRPGHEFAKYDHRVYRPAGWVEAGAQKIAKMQPIADKYGISLLQLACLWNLSHEPVRSVVPTLIQEIGAGSKSIEAKVDDLATLPDIGLSVEEVEEIASIGNNKGCMDLKGGNPQHEGEAMADRWGLSSDLLDVARRWSIDPVADLICTHKAGH
jgi:aryl-alcohol dehydrogenase-like predicted oxidoreductase